MWKNGIAPTQWKTDVFVLRMELLQFSWQHKEDIWMSSDCCFPQELRLTSHGRYDQHFRVELGSNFIVMKINTGIFSRHWVPVEVFHWKTVCGCSTFCVLVQIGNMILKSTSQSFLKELKLKALLHIYTLYPMSHHPWIFLKDSVDGALGHMVWWWTWQLDSEVFSSLNDAMILEQIKPLTAPLNRFEPHACLGQASN